MSRRTRITGMLAATVLLSTTALGAASAARAATSPAPVYDVTRTDIAVMTPDHSLKVYWQKTGTTTWKHQTVASGSAYSSPAVVRDGSSHLVITAEGPNHSLKVWWGVPGGTWKHKTIATAGTYSAPSIAADGGQVVIAVQGKSDELRGYFSTNLTTWYGAEFAPGTAYSKPSVAVSGGEIYFATRQTGNQLELYYGDNYSLWNGVSVGITSGAPALTPDSNLLLIAAPYVNGGMLFYWAFAATPNTWSSEVVENAGYAASAPSISVNPGVSPSRINIAFEGVQHTAIDFWQNTGGTGWVGQLAGPQNAAHAAVGVSYSTVGSLIVTTGPGNSLYMFSETNGTTAWVPEKVAGSGSVG